MSVGSVAAGRYRIRRRLGEGGMASVYLAHDAELDRQVAVKVLAEHLAGDREIRTRFLREGRLAARLTHPNVVAVYDAGEEEGLPYLVMEHVAGETLAALLARRGRLPPGEAVALVLQACDGLEHAHAAGLVHRDVKPQNLLVTHDGTVKVADFGIARAEGSTQVTQAGTILGTAAYLAPEQATGGAVGPPADVYSLGAVLYELLAGRPPFEDETLEALLVRHRAGPAAPPRPLEGDVPAELEEVVMRTLARLPEYRPPSAAALAEQLRAAGGDLPTEEMHEPPPPAAATEVLRRPRRSVGRATAVAAVAAASLAAFVLAVALVRGTGTDAPPPAPAEVEPVPQADTPEDQARGLADWIRRHSG
jgi:eukaryotic-like serine/threonine-protein kinase